MITPTAVKIGIVLLALLTGGAVVYHYSHTHGHGGSVAHSCKVR